MPASAAQLGERPTRDQNNTGSLLCLDMRILIQTKNVDRNTNRVK